MSGPPHNPPVPSPAHADATSVTFSELGPETTPATPSPPAAAVFDAEPKPLPPRASARPRRWRRVIVASGFVLVAVATAVFLIALALTQEDPRWWTRVDPSNPKTIQTAEAVENGIASVLTQVRGEAADSRGSSGQPGATTHTAPAAPDSDKPKPWRVFVTTEQANAWLNVRLERWLADQTEQGVIDFRWPEAVKQVQVSFEDGRIHVGAKVMRPGAPGERPRPQTVGASLRPEFGQDGSLWLTAERIEIGRLPVPAGWVLGSASKARERKVGEVSDELAQLPQTQKVIEAFNGDRPVIARPVIKLADGRRVRLLSIEPKDGKLVITAQTEVREAPRP